MEKIEEELNKEKPKILYHGSAHKNVEELEPRRGSYRDLDEGELLFATPDLAMATIFMVGRRHYGCGKFGDVHYAWIIAERDDFIKNDKGGHIYVLPGDTFECDPNKGLGKNEWTSKEKVKPLDKIEFDSALDAMVEHGVQVYFIEDNTRKKIEASDDHGRMILKSLESENQRRGVNVKDF